MEDWADVRLPGWRSAVIDGAARLEGSSAGSERHLEPGSYPHECAGVQRVPFGGGGFLYLALSCKACMSAGRCVGVPDPECRCTKSERLSAGLERLRAGL